MPASGDDLTQQQVYDVLMKSTFAPALRSLGLKGSAGRFELPSDRYWAQLGFQKSSFSDSASLKFTVNLSVIVRDTWTEQSTVNPRLGTKPAPNTFYGSWAEQTRVGRLTPSGEDLWWWLTQGEDPLPIADDVVSVLQNVAVPWLASKARP
jgi:hypothetical protein